MQPHYSQSSRENATPSSGHIPISLLLGRTPAGTVYNQSSPNPLSKNTKDPFTGLISLDAK